MQTHAQLNVFGSINKSSGSLENPGRDGLSLASIDTGLTEKIKCQVVRNVGKGKFSVEKTYSVISCEVYRLTIVEDDRD
jgi:hypothetical protein